MNDNALRSHRYTVLYRTISIMLLASLVAGHHITGVEVSPTCKDVIDQLVGGPTISLTP